MCAIFGALVRNITGREALARVNAMLEHIYMASWNRGRDGRGYILRGPKGIERKRNDPSRMVEPPSVDIPFIKEGVGPRVLIGNCRAEPTTEYVRVKRRSDQQPYTGERWSIVHNGTIANDKELRSGRYMSMIDSAAVLEAIEDIEEDGRLTSSFDCFRAAVGKLKGSYAILASRQDESGVIYFAANYRPIWYIETEDAMYFASTRDSFPEYCYPKMIKPYSWGIFTANQNEFMRLETSLHKESFGKPKSLVVCSGGLDSVVSAMYVQKVLGHDVELIHFLYGSRAQRPEVEAVKKVADFMGVPLKLFNLPVYDKSDSPLLDETATVAGGEAGAEFAHEWVPARNLLLLSVATAYAEAKGHNFLVLGNNMEEAGAYPDNEPEFINKFNDLLPFAVGDGKRLQVLMPVGNMMKHEIVALGHKLGAPMHLTWSCYRAGEKHCGTCGPCFMRKTAFEINNLPEVIDYV